MIEVCGKCGRVRPDYICDPTCQRRGYCNWTPRPELCDCILCKGKQSHPLTEPNRVYVEPGTFDGLARRVAELERIHTERLDMHVARLERLERPVDERDAIAWEIGHAAGARGDSAESNPFRKGGR